MLGLILLSLKLFMFAKFCKAGGTGPLWVPVPTQPFHSRVYLHQVSHVCDDLFKQVQLFALPLNIFRCSTALALGSGRTLSSAYVLPSAKKAFSSARAIVSIFSAPLSLYQLLPKPVLIISPQAMFMNFLDLAFAQKNTSISLAMFNQDLAGLFISIDTPRFLESCAMLLKFLSSKMSAGTGEFFPFRPTKANNPGGLKKKVVSFAECM